MPTRDHDMDSILQLLGSIDANVKTLMIDNGDKEERIRKLEQWQWKTLGAASAVSAVVAFLFKILTR